MDQRKAALVEALAAKCAALLELLQLEEPELEQPQGGDEAAAAETAKSDSVASDNDSTVAVVGAAAAAEAATVEAVAPPVASFEAAFRELRKWVDTAADDKVWRGCVRLPGKRMMDVGMGVGGGE